VRRRDLLASAGAAAFASPLTGRRGSATEKPFRVGIASLINDRTAPQFVAFEERLRQLMNGSGRELIVDFLVLGGDGARYPAAARELVSRDPDVLLAPGPEISLKAAHAATQTIPIVMSAVDYDPVAFGYVVSLAHPGGNITGVFLNSVEIAAKRVGTRSRSRPSASRC